MKSSGKKALKPIVKKPGCDPGTDDIGKSVHGVPKHTHAAQTGIVLEGKIDGVKFYDLWSALHIVANH